MSALLTIPLRLPIELVLDFARLLIEPSEGSVSAVDFSLPVDLGFSW